jgi:glutamate formiminotransferase
LTTLLAVPNFSEGRDLATLQAISAAFGPAQLDRHTDPDHHRSVFTVAGGPGALAPLVARAAGVALGLIDLRRHEGIHPRVGVLDVAPIVYLDDAGRGAAAAEALILGDLLSSELGLPVFLYGDLADGRTRAELRRGGPAELAGRMTRGELRADFGPRAFDPRSGAVLVAARPPLVAFNVELAPPAGLAQARRIASLIRDGGAEGLPGVRAIGLWLEHSGRAQVSTNVEDHRRTPLAAVVAAVARHAQPAGAELVGLAPEAALDGFPAEIELRGRQTIEGRLGD